LIDKESLNIPKEAPVKTASGRELDDCRLVRRKEQLRPLGAVPI
jgi:hypothetical protein